MLARSVIIDVEGPPAEVLTRMQARLLGDLGWATELLLPATRFGSGPPDFLGRIAGRSFRLHTTWRPNFAAGQKSQLEVRGLVDAHLQGSRVRAVIRPRKVMYLTLLPVAPMLVMFLVQPAFRVELVIVAVLVVLYFVVLVGRDIRLTALGLDALLAKAAAPPTSA